MAKLAMTPFQLSCVFLLVTWSAGSRAEDSKALSQQLVKHALKGKRGMDIWLQSDIVADLQLAHLPHADLEVKYTGAKVVINKTLEPEQAASAPSISVLGVQICGPPYMLVMVDPDVPRRDDPKERSWLHWLVVNINDRNYLEQGDVVMPYEGPKPSPGTGTHRYVFLAFCQNPGTTLRPEEVAPKARNNFMLSEFTSKLIYPSPFAGTFFYVEYA